MHTVSTVCIALGADVWCCCCHRLKWRVEHADVAAIDTDVRALQDMGAQVLPDTQPKLTKAQLRSPRIYSMIVFLPEHIV